jgi:hypothetical protein
MLKKPSSKIRMGQNWSDTFLVQNDLKQNALTPLHFNFSLVYPGKKFEGKNKRFQTLCTRQVLMKEYENLLG